MGGVTQPVRKTPWALVFVALLFLLAGPHAALAADFTVNSTADAVDANPGDGVCETATAGQCTPRVAGS